MMYADPRSSAWLLPLSLAVLLWTGLADPLAAKPVQLEATYFYDGDMSP